MTDQRTLTYDEILIAAAAHVADAQWFNHHGNTNLAHAAYLRAMMELSSLPESLYWQHVRPVIAEVISLEVVIKNAR